MARFLKKRTDAKGAAPGSYIFLGSKKMDKVKIRLFSYDEKDLREQEFGSIDEALQNIENGKVNWLNVDGLHEVKIHQKIAETYAISPLAMENILNTGQRCKLFEDKDSLTLVTKAVYLSNDNGSRISVEQISFILMEGVLISFQEKVGDHFEAVRDRIRSGVGRIRKAPSEYLMYALIDSLVDNYLINIEQLGEQIEEMESRIPDAEKSLSTELFHMKREISYFRKSIKPLKEVMTRLLRLDTELIHQDYVIFYQELYDLVDQSIEATDNYFNMLSDHINLYNTAISNRVNDVMKVLTIFASIFIPLTFIAGIYGTNFEYLPELHYKYSYFVMWGIMVVVAGTMLYYFRKQRWF